MKYTAAVITVSDMGSRGLRQDTSGPAVRAMLEEAGFSVAHTAILPDEMEQISAELRNCADRRRIDLIVTTGGTGLSPRDVTPEATRARAGAGDPCHPCDHVDGGTEGHPPSYAVPGCGRDQGQQPAAESSGV